MYLQGIITQAAICLQKLYVFLEDLFPDTVQSNIFHVKRGFEFQLRSVSFEKSLPHLS